MDLDNFVLMKTSLECKHDLQHYPFRQEDCNYDQKEHMSHAHQGLHCY